MIDFNTQKKKENQTEIILLNQCSWKSVPEAHQRSLCLPIAQRSYFPCFQLAENREQYPIAKAILRPHHQLLQLLPENIKTFHYCSHIALRSVMECTKTTHRWPRYNRKKQVEK